MQITKITFFTSKNNKGLLNKLTTKFMMNTGWLVFEQIFRMGLSLIVTSLMARYLGIQDFSLLNYSLTFVMIFTTVSNLGIDSIIVNEIIKNRKNTGTIIGTTILLRFASSLLSVFLVFLTIVILKPDDFIIQMITVIQSISLLFVVFDSLEYWFHSNLQSKYIVISKSIAFTVVAIWRLILIFLEKNIYYFAVATIIEVFVISLVIVIFYVRLRGPKLNFSYRIGKQLLSKGFFFFIAGILIMVYTQVDKIMLGQFANNTSVGIYVAAMSISSLWMFVPNALVNSARPVIMTWKLESENAYIKKYKQLYCAIIWIGIVASIIISVFSKQIILLIYGDQFIDSIHVLIILIWSRIFSLIGITRLIWLTVENLGKYQMHFVGIGAIINLICNFLLIPKYGAIGAAIATLLAEVISSFLAILIFKQTRPLFKLIVESFLFKGVISSSK